MLLQKQMLIMEESMAIRIETETIPSKTIETVVVTMSPEDYASYRKSRFLMTSMTSVYSDISCQGSITVAICTINISLTKFALSVPNALGLSLLLAFIVCMTALFLSGNMDQQQMTLQENLLRRNGLFYSPWSKAHPPYRVESKPSHL
jgi:hypothetical protein